MTNTQKIYINNLIKGCDILQAQMSALVNECSPDSLEAFAQDPRMAKIQKSIQRYIEAVEAIFKHKSGSAANLSVRSRRAYQWLKFLSEGEYFRQHMLALERLYQFNAKISASRSKKNLVVKIHLYHIGDLYQIREKNSSLEITVPEAFIAAPQNVLEAIVNIAHHVIHLKDGLITLNERKG